MRIKTKIGNFDWIEDWVKIPETPSGKENGRTHGVVVSKTGNILIFHQANPGVLVYDSHGKLLMSWGEFLGAHGMTLVEEDGMEYLWLTDQHSGKVVKTTLDGKEIQSIQKPDHPIYKEKKYAPTWVAINQSGGPAHGDIWVTDGYGSHMIHRYDKNGKYLKTIDGTEGAGRYNCPHGIWIDTRRSNHELYIADRSNRRVQVYDLEGNFKRSFGENFLSSPDGFITVQDKLIIPELKARVTILDENDQFLDYIGRNESVREIDGWPNLHKSLIQPGKFNSPHGIAADSNSNFYIVEWIVGGRITKLQRVE
jgi:hypothetical protein